jgi:RimJ/RimL family protein N-acetyltransferase
LDSFWRKYDEDCSGDREILILEDDCSPKGYVQAVFEDSSIGLSMGIIEAARGKGYGKQIISLAINYYQDCNCFFCYIREDNKASMGSFKANGFKEVEGTYTQLFPLDVREFLMRRYELHR